MEKVFVKKVGKNGYVENVKDLNLDYMQRKVGGLIDIPLINLELTNKGIDIVCNDEGLELKPNIAVVTTGNNLIYINGDVIFTSFDEESDSIGLNNKQIKYLKKLLKEKRIIIEL